MAKNKANKPERWKTTSATFTESQYEEIGKLAVAENRRTMANMVATLALEALAARKKK